MEFLKLFGIIDQRMYQSDLVIDLRIDHTVFRWNRNAEQRKHSERIIGSRIGQMANRAYIMDSKNGHERTREMTYRTKTGISILRTKAKMMENDRNDRSQELLTFLGDNRYSRFSFWLWYFQVEVRVQMLVVMNGSKH